MAPNPNIKLKIASQNIKGYTRADKDNDYIIDIINGMHRGGYHSPCYRILSIAINPNIWHLTRTLNSTHTLNLAYLSNSLWTKIQHTWEITLIWHNSGPTEQYGLTAITQSVIQVDQLSGIVLSNLAAKALETAIKTLGRDKCILQFGPRLLATRLIFKDIKGKEVQFIVASAYAPPTGNTRYGERMDEFYVTGQNYWMNAQRKTYS